MPGRCPVLVLPGWGAGDRSTIGLRGQLRLAGHPAHTWQQGTNDGALTEVLPALESRLLDLVDRYRRPVAIVGWSLGGIYACHLGDRYPAQTRQIITLGSPLRSRIAVRPPSDIPLTAIWSRNDRVVSWRRAAIEPGKRAENIEVRATHITLGFDPLVMGAILDRLAVEPDDWKPFRPPAWLRAAYP
ncbi:MAG: esterase/lipase family protein [Acidimicrobiales bacterium]